MEDSLSIVNYGWPEMPSGPFVGEVYHLTHDLIKTLGAAMPDNDTFIAAETLLRNYVWRATQRAHYGTPARPHERFERAMFEDFARKRRMSLCRRADKPHEYAFATQRAWEAWMIRATTGHPRKDHTQ